MADGRAKNGGAREGAGRKKIADESKAKERILRALKAKYSTDVDEDAIEAFLIEFSESKEGLKFFAEHLLGKPTDKIDHTTGGDKIGQTPFEIKVIRPEE